VAAHAPQLLEGADLFSYDASIDAYGGGGYVSTARELVSFYRALLTGRVFDQPATLALMQTVPDVNVESHYAMGIEQVVGDCWGHDGFWGTEAVYCPQQGLGLAVAGMSVESLNYLVGDIVGPVLREAAACAAAGVEP
jgi:CubicO group peptidase (beta-lactamase class C family)